MKGKRATTIASIIATLTVLIVAAAAHANVQNSLQPAHVYFGRVPAGQHPNRLVTLHNGTGRQETIGRIGIAGAGGYVFTMVGRSALLTASPYPRCVVGMTLAPGARCVIDVRVHTLRAGWWRSVLSVTTNTGFQSAELRAHVTPSLAARGYGL